MDLRHRSPHQYPTSSPTAVLRHLRRGYCAAALRTNRPSFSWMPKVLSIQLESGWRQSLIIAWRLDLSAQCNRRPKLLRNEIGLGIWIPVSNGAASRR